MATLEPARSAETALDPYLASDLTSTEIDARRTQVREAILDRSTYIREPQFARINTRDLVIAFERYDALFFGMAIWTVLGDRPLTFRLSTRATSRGGSLHTFRPRQATPAVRPESFEMTVSTTLLFESFRDGQRSITIGGNECSDRLDALQRIVEHETVHLVEQLRWRDSDCSAPRFHSMARRLFGHTEHKHALVTPRERAADLGFRPGQRVAFEFEGVRHEGILNRVTKRATVLVVHPDGEMMGDGKRYNRFYVPLQRLQHIVEQPKPSESHGDLA